MRVDLGGIAKGFALDQAAAAMRAAGAAGGMADLGGNIVVFGIAPGGGRGWAIGIRDPRGQGILGSVVLDSGSVATSGDYERFFERDGIRYSHIVDPRSAEPARGIAQVTVAAPDGITADALSTALFILGPTAGRSFLDGGLVPGVAVLWVRDPGPRAVEARDLEVAGTGGPPLRLGPGPS
jgi:thiamine biosynthesis lipoprotein